MTLAPSTKLGPYEIIAALGTGGMGEVYRARDSRLNREVAIKILPGSFAANDERLQRFTREAQAASALNHPNIVAVFDVGTHEGTPYLVTELLQGETLRDRLLHGPLPLSKALDFARQTAAGLAAAHQHGIIHRDIKPANLLITTDGRVKILDFGLAKQEAHGDADLTQPQSLTNVGVVMGTLGYMSPEQVRGAATDARTDIFSFGTVLYEMVAGRQAFSGPSSVETMHAILAADPPDVPPSVAHASPPLARLIARCLEKDPAHRFHSAHDLGLGLEMIAAGPGSGAPTVIAPAAHTRGAPAALWAVSAIAAVAIGALIYKRLAPAPVPELTTLDSLTYSGHDASPAGSPDGRTVAFMSDRDGVPRIWLKQVDGGGELGLTQGPDNFPRFSPDGSTIIFVRTTPSGTALYRVPLLGGDPHKLLDDVAGADWSPDGRQLAFTRWVSGARSGSVIGVAAADGTSQREITFVKGRALIMPRWSPDGRLIAAVNGLATVATGFGVEIADVSRATSRRLPPATAGMRQSSVVWSADSRTITFSEARSIVAWLAGSSARLIRQDVTTGNCQPIFWLANHSQTLDVLKPGRLLLDTRSSRENLREIPIGGGLNIAPRWLTRGNSTDRQPTYSPDGQWIAFSSNRGGNLDLWAVNRANGVVRRLTDDPADDWDVSYSPDGRRLLWGSNRSGAYEVWAANPDGSGAQQLSHDGFFAQNPGQTVDGRSIIYVSTNPAHVGLWRMGADGRDPVRILEEVIQLPDVSPDGRYALYVESLAGRIRVVTLPDGRAAAFDIPIVRHKDTTAVLGRARWMPDGRAIAYVGQDERGVNGVFVQDFAPGRDTTSTRRQIGGFDAETSAESFAISPDGKTITIAGWEQMFNIVIANRVPGLEALGR